MTAIPRAHPAESLVRAGVVGALAARGVTRPRHPVEAAALQTETAR